MWEENICNSFDDIKDDFVYKIKNLWDHFTESQKKVYYDSLNDEFSYIKENELKNFVGLRAYSQLEQHFQGKSIDAKTYKRLSKKLSEYEKYFTFKFVEHKLIDNHISEILEFRKNEYHNSNDSKKCYKVKKHKKIQN